MPFEQDTKSKLALPCLRGVLGTWVYYSSVMTANQIAGYISTEKEIREATSLDEVLQRKLKERKHQIGKYLLKKDSRFFNSIIIGVFGGVPKWLEFDLSDQFTEYLSGDEIEYTEGSMGIMLFQGNEQMFAIDGQHRVEGIKIALAEDNKLPIEERKLTEDQFSVIFIAHIDNEEGRKRTRRLFSDINTNAKPVSKGDRIIIDEDDLNSIVARRIYSNYPHFQSGAIISLSENANLDKDDTTNFTNLVTLHSVNKVLKRAYYVPRGDVPSSPEHIEAFFQFAISFYDFIINKVDDLKAYFIEQNIGLEAARVNNRLLLFRPVGLILLSRLFLAFHKREDLDFLGENINRISFTFPESIYNKVLWNQGKMETRAKNQKLAEDLSVYVLGKLPTEKENDLLIRYREVTKDEDAILPEKISLT